MSFANMQAPLNLLKVAITALTYTQGLRDLMGGSNPGASGPITLLLQVNLGQFFLRSTENFRTYELRDYAASLKPS